MQVLRATLDGVQTVAVKQLLEQNEYQQQKFVNEIAILRSCRNENIVCFLGEWATWCMGTLTASSTQNSKLEFMAEAADHNAVCLAEVHLLRA